MDEVKKFCRIKRLPDSEKDLYKLAARSYYAMPAKDRHKWTLEQIDIQGI